jgi:hypothetical protein
MAITTGLLIFYVHCIKFWQGDKTAKSGAAYFMSGA